MRFALLLLAFVACTPAAAPTTRTAIAVGTSGDYPPWSDWAGARPVGIGPAIFDAFATNHSYEPRYQRFRWATFDDDIRHDRFALAVDGMTVRPERSVVGRFTVPIAVGGAVLLLRRPDWAHSADLRELDKPALRVAVNRGGHLERITREKLHDATIRAVDGNAAVKELLARHEVDALMTNTFEAPRWAEGIAGIERIGPLGCDVTAFWVRADESALADRFDAWLVDEENAGRLLETRKKWLGDDGVPAANPVFALLAATAERLALMPWVAHAKHAAGLPIEDLAQEAKVLEASRRAVDDASKGAPLRPDPAAVERFFRLQITAAKAVQVKEKPTAFSLEELRRAIARISARMAFLAAHVPLGSNPQFAIGQARIVLAESGLDTDAVDAIALAAVGLAPPTPYR